MAVQAEANMADSVADMGEDEDVKKMSGRRKKAAKAKQAKPGSFGTAVSAPLSPRQFLPATIDDTYRLLCVYLSI